MAEAPAPSEDPVVSSSSEKKQGVSPATDSYRAIPEVQHLQCTTSKIAPDLTVEYVTSTVKEARDLLVTGTEPKFTVWLHEVAVRQSILSPTLINQLSKEFGLRNVFGPGPRRNRGLGSIFDHVGTHLIRQMYEGLKPTAISLPVFQDVPGETSLLFSALSAFNPLRVIFRRRRAELSFDNVLLCQPRRGGGAISKHHQSIIFLFYVLTGLVLFIYLLPEEGNDVERETVTSKFANSFGCLKEESRLSQPRPPQSHRPNSKCSGDQDAQATDLEAQDQVVQDQSAQQQEAMDQQAQNQEPNSQGDHSLDQDQKVRDQEAQGEGAPDAGHQEQETRHQDPRDEEDAVNQPMLPRVTAERSGVEHSLRQVLKLVMLSYLLRALDCGHYIDIWNIVASNDPSLTIEPENLSRDLRWCTTLASYTRKVIGLVDFLLISFEREATAANVRELDERISEVRFQTDQLAQDTKESVEILQRTWSMFHDVLSMEEGRRVKYLTILASLFLPLSLASSILSMSSRFTDLHLILYDFLGVFFLVSSIGLIFLLLIVIVSSIRPGVEKRLSEISLGVDKFRKPNRKPNALILSIVTTSKVLVFLRQRSKYFWRLLTILLCFAIAFAWVIFTTSFIVGMTVDVRLGGKILGYTIAGTLALPVCVFLVYVAVSLLVGLFECLGCY